MAIWSRLTGGIAAFGIGAAAADAIEPELETTKQQAWGERAVRVLDPSTAALADAERLDAPIDFEDDAKRSGIGHERYLILRDLAFLAPGVADALTLWRRKEIGEDEVNHALRKAKLPREWWPPLKALKDVLLTPEELAVMVQRGVVPDPGYLPVGPPSGRGKVPPMPVADIATAQEAAGSGYSHERMAALARIVGLPASPDLAARMVFRKIINRIDFDRAIAEGNTRNEWADFLFEGFREILTAHNYAELQLRGYIDREERLAGTAKHGMSVEDSDLLYDVLGRSIPVHQIETGQARGGVYDGPTDGIPAPYLAAMRRGNLRPEYYNLAFANRYSYPSGFMIRGLAQDGELTREETHQILLEVGWSPKWATTFSERWTTGSAAAADPNVKKAQTQLWTATHRAYIGHEIEEGEARLRLSELGIDAAAQDAILGLWELERELVRRQLTPTQIKKAYKSVVENPATGQAWTWDDAIGALLGLGFDYNSAATLLAE